MKQTIGLRQFQDSFRTMGRGDQFSYEALELIFDYLEECDSEMELDVIAVCCDYSEDSPEQVIESYGIEYDEDEPQASEAATAYLEANTTVIGTTSTGAIVYASNF